jgi:phosphohistidine phosphatase
MAGQLWLLRHGDAEPHGARSDFERRLTERGERQAHAAGQALARMGVRFSDVLTSPKVRARDTARLAAAAWGQEPQLHEALAGDFDADQALDLLGSEDGDARLLVVGHEPDLSQTVEELSGARIDLKKGGLAVVRVDDGAGELVMLLRPRELAQMAGVGEDPR